MRRPVHPGPLEEACRQPRRARPDLVCRSARRASSACSSTCSRPRRRAAAVAAGAPGHARLPAGGLRHGHRDDPRGTLRAVRRRHAACVHHELRRAVGRVHGRLPQLRPDARVVRRDLPARRGLRRPAGHRCAPGVRARRAADRRRLRPELRRHGQGDPQGATGERRRSSGCSTIRGRRRRCSTRR